jgi:hypothetical protein
MAVPPSHALTLFLLIQRLVLYYFSSHPFFGRTTEKKGLEPVQQQNEGSVFLLSTPPPQQGSRHTLRDCENGGSRKAGNEKFIECGYLNLKRK